jgi:NAD(P)-dependent dehydrogenase (short-subunit alcohol dehydrogenase family)
MNDKSKWNTTRQYFLVKLASYYFFQGLANQVKEEGLENKIIVNMADPGFCKTNMILGKVPLIAKPIVLFQYMILGRSAEVGARTLVGATTKGPESSGKLWRNDVYQE